MMKQIKVRCPHYILQSMACICRIYHMTKLDTIIPVGNCNLQLSNQTPIYILIHCITRIWTKTCTHHAIDTSQILGTVKHTASVNVNGIYSIATASIATTTWWTTHWLAHLHFLRWGTIWHSHWAPDACWMIIVPWKSPWRHTTCIIHVTRATSWKWPTTYKM